MTCGTDLEQHVNGKISYIPRLLDQKNADKYFDCKRMMKKLKIDKKFQLYHSKIPKPRKRLENIPFYSQKHKNI